MTWPLATATFISSATASFKLSLPPAGRRLPAAIAGTLGWHLPEPDPTVLARTWAAELDRHGVTRAVLIASIPGDEPSVLAATAAVPGRFYAYAMVNPVAAQAAVTAGLRCHLPLPRDAPLFRG